MQTLLFVYVDDAIAPLWRCQVVGVAACTRTAQFIFKLTNCDNYLQFSTQFEFTNFPIRFFFFFRSLSYCDTCPYFLYVFLDDCVYQTDTVPVHTQVDTN